MNYVLSNLQQLEVEQIPIVPLYFAKRRPVIQRDEMLLYAGELNKPKPGEKVTEMMVRFRTLGCQLCTGAVQSNAETLAAIIEEIMLARKSERQGRAEERAIYKEFSCISKSIEDLRDRGLSGSEVSRVNAYLSRFITAFETVKHIYQFRTPITLRMYSRIFIYVILIVLGPYFAILAEGQALWLAFIKPIIFAMVFTGLDNIQEHLENPFDQVGEDDIRINPDKFLETLNE